VNANPTIGGTLTACVGLTSQLTGSVTPAAVSPWTSSVPGFATVSNTGLVTAVSAGTTVITYTNNSGCLITANFVVNANPTITGTLTVCEGFDTQLTGSGTPDGTAPWSSSSIANATVSNNGLVVGILAGTSDITYTDINGCFTSSTVTINLTPTTPTMSADVNYCSSATPDDLVAVAGFAGTLNWYSDPTLLVNIGTGATLSPSMTVGTNNYYVTETLNGCEGPASSTVQIISLCDIEIPTAFTPDADKVNDNWELKFLDQTFPNNQVRVYNRWGNLLFESEKGKYETKPFDGTYNGEDLPVASYYFIIEYNNAEEESKTGNVTIIRK
jgi:gliding motility-associated-like protein